MDDWLATPSQILRSVIEGAVYDDGLGVLRSAQAALRWYPQDVWLHVLACQWRRIAQQEHLVGRAAEVVDELGSRLLAAQLVRGVVRSASSSSAARALCEVAGLGVPAARGRR